MQHNQINELDALITREYGNTAGLLVLKNGKTAYEQYFNGYGASDAFHIFSVTKSVFSTLIGIAMDDGCISSLDQRVLDFFPDYTVKRGETTIQRITLRDMMTMTAPFKYKSAPYTKYFSSEDWVKTALDLLGGKGEIGRFRYTPLIGPDILSGILTRATGRSALAFAGERLFEPMGISVSQPIVFHSKEEQLSIMKNHHTCGWVADPQGVNTTGWGLYLRLRDMAKIGQLYLDGGVYEGQQLVSASWIAAATSEHSRWEELGLRYGYLWWLINDNEHSFSAMGDGGNVIYVNPVKNIVVAIAALFKPRAKDRISLIREEIEPLFYDA